MGWRIQGVCIQQWVQNLEGVDLGKWMVYLFCDDTAFVAENPNMMDVLLN